MKAPLYFKQAKQATCSLAVLRMALNYFGIIVTEAELEEKISTDYGKNYSNIWNPTIAKLACGYGLITLFTAEWPLLKKGVLNKAVKEFENDPVNFNATKYENPRDKDEAPEPLPLAYKEMFRAVKLGCHTKYGKLTTDRLTKLLNNNYLIQTSIKLQLLYPASKQAFHSILIYGMDKNNVYYHDPFMGKGLTCQINQLLKAAQDTGVFMAYKKSLVA